MADEQIPPELVQALYKSKLVDELLVNPGVRKDFLGVVKKYNPTIRIPEIDTPEEINTSVVKPLMDKVDALTKRLDAEAEDRTKTTRHHKAVAAGLAEDEIGKVDALAKERGISDYDTALEFYTVTKRAANPRHYDKVTPLELPNMKGLFEDPTGWARKTAHDVINEIVQSRR